MHSNTTTAVMGHGLRRSLYRLTLLLLAVTGFAQMPIFKRYYIADIPGLGWLAQFYTTHVLHYLASALLIGIIFYVAVDYRYHFQKSGRLTWTGLTRLALLGGIVISGVFRAVFNLEGYLFSPPVVIGLNLLHLGLVMLFLFFCLYCLVFKKKWTSIQ